MTNNLSNFYCLILLFYKPSSHLKILATEYIVLRIWILFHRCCYMWWVACASFFFSHQMLIKYEYYFTVHKNEFNYIILMKISLNLKFLFSKLGRFWTGFWESPYMCVCVCTVIKNTRYLTLCAVVTKRSITNYISTQPLLKPV